MTTYQIWIVLLLLLFVVLTFLGCWLRSARVFGFGVVAFAVYMLSQVIYNL